MLHIPWVYPGTIPTTHPYTRFEMASRDELENKANACYYLGTIYSWVGKYDEAVPYLLISQQNETFPLKTTFYLGLAYLRNMEYDESVIQFRSLFDKVQEKLKEEDSSIEKIIESGFGDDFTLGELQALAYWGQAFAYAERGANLDRALDLIKKAEVYIKAIDEKDSSKVQYPSNYLDCKGWILFKQHILDERDTIDQAITCLKDAISIAADAEAYLHLALAYEYKLQATQDEAEAHYLSMLVKTYCQHILELDFYGKYKSRVNDLQQHLIEKSLEMQQKSAKEQKLSVLTNN